jgi:hypothetical protein
MFNKIISFENKIMIHQNSTIAFIYFLFNMKTLIPYFLKYIDIFVMHIHTQNASY